MWLRDCSTDGLLPFPDGGVQNVPIEMTDAPESDGPKPSLSISFVSKQFGGEQALDGVSISVAPGEIRAIVGETGAGKSTLMRIVAGLETPDTGEVRVFGEALSFTPHASRLAGVALVHQELSLVPTLSVAENLALGHLPRRGGLVSRRAMLRSAREIMDRVHPGLDVEETVSRLSLAKRQFIEIAKALIQSPRILVLDEPTASLSLTEDDELAVLVAGLAAEGMSVIFVSHRIGEIFGLCSTATVLKDGVKVAAWTLASSSPDELVRLMVGRDLGDPLIRPPRPGAPIALRVRNLTTDVVKNVSFELREGEILGIGGLVGAGRTEMVRAVCRLDPLNHGDAGVREAEEIVTLRSYRQAIRLGVAFVPEDRHLEGLAMDLSVGDNAVASSVGELSRFGFLARGARQRLASTIVKLYDVRPPTPDLPASKLSGGNQQKVVLGKWLHRPLRVLILDEPTRGVDVAAKAQVHGLLKDAADKGTGVIVVSSDLPELISVSDRVLVMCDGRVTAELTGSQITEETVMRYATP